MNFIKLTSSSWNCEIFINPEYIIRMIWDNENNETGVVTEEGEIGVKESPEQIIEMIKETK